MQCARNFTVVSATLLAMSAASISRADDIFVPADQPSIQAAIDVAVSSDSVIVAPGTYAERIDFSGKDIIVESSGGAAVTTIDGGAGGSVVTIANGESAAAILRGFTIQNGMATDGGGVRVNGASPIIENNIIQNNVACNGAGVIVRTGGATIRSNTFTGNMKNACATGFGGGVGAFDGAQVEIRANIFSGNSNTYGGGIGIDGAGASIVADNRIDGNSATNQGGGVSVFNVFDFEFVQNVVYGNTAQEGGGIVWFLDPNDTAQLTAIANTIYENPITRPTFGSGILSHGGQLNAVTRNNIVIASAGQTAIDCRVDGAGLGQFNNNLTFASGTTDYFGDCAGQESVNGNLTGGTDFVSPVSGDFRLVAASQAIDAALDDPALTADILGNPRRVDGNDDTVVAQDIGALEAQAPAADAGLDQTVSTSSVVTLDASGSDDIDGVIAAYSWTQTAGAGVTLSDDQMASPTFTAPASSSSLTFSVTVTDDAGLTAADNVAITVTGSNQSPVADAGSDQTVDASSLVTLDASGSSDPDGTIVSYAWSQTTGTSVSLSDAQAQMPTFTAPASASNLIFSMTVTDNDGATATDTVAVTVNAPNQSPNADAGPNQVVDASSLVTLDATGSSDPDGTIATFAWNQTGGASVTLSDPASASPTFTAPGSATVLTFALTVTDDDGATAMDSVMITVNDPNQPPVANAGADQVVSASAPVTLDASGSSDPDGTIVSYSWSQTSGTTVTLSDSQVASPTFTAPASASSLVFTVTVTDDDGSSAMDSVAITVNSGSSQPPIADAGPDQTVDASSTVTLDASGSSDQDGTIVSYGWTQTAGTAVTLSDPAAVSPTFLAPGSAATLTFSVLVTDDDGLTATDTVVVTVNVPNQSPVANAGPDQTVNASSTVSLDASGSSDPDGTIATFAWIQTGGTTVTLSNSATATPTFAAPSAAANLSFSVTVTDNGGLTDTDSVSITVNAPPPPPPPPPPPTSSGGGGAMSIVWFVLLTGLRLLFYRGKAVLRRRAE